MLTKIELFLDNYWLYSSLPFLEQVRFYLVASSLVRHQDMFCCIHLIFFVHTAYFPCFYWYTIEASSFVILKKLYGSLKLDCSKFTSFNWESIEYFWYRLIILRLTKQTCRSWNFCISHHDLEWATAQLIPGNQDKNFWLFSHFK